LAEPQLSVRVAKARDLALRLARREQRSIADIVERALEAYGIREAGRVPAASFYARLSQDFGTDIDLDALIRATRSRHPRPLIAWLERHDAELALPTVTISEVALGIGKIRPDE
jgi:hypothetical protein